MPEIDGLTVQRTLAERGVTMPIIIMTGHGDVPLAVAAMRKGAYSFLEKPFRESALEETLSQAFAHAETRPLEPAAPPAPRAGTPETSEGPPPLPPAAARLTARERQVLELVVQGKLNKTIADILGISIKTVELHRANMMQKMGARSITDLMRRVLTGAESGA